MSCGREDCYVSTGIHEGLTFGRGRLDDHGFWEEPCAECARTWEAKFPSDAPCWPYEDTPTKGVAKGEP